MEVNKGEKEWKLSSKMGRQAVVVSGEKAEEEEEEEDSNSALSVSFPPSFPSSYFLSSTFFHLANWRHKSRLNLSRSDQQGAYPDELDAFARKWGRRVEVAARAVKVEAIAAVITLDESHNKMEKQTEWWWANCFHQNHMNTVGELFASPESDLEVAYLTRLSCRSSTLASVEQARRAVGASDPTARAD